MAEESIAPEERIRKLASIQAVTELCDHPDPETKTLQIASVLGWQCVISKDENVIKGQPIIFCEIDSMLPGNAEWLPDAIKKRVDSQKKKDFFRVKTIRLRGELSQGLIINNLPDGVYEIGHDVTNELGIKKYEPPVCNTRFTKSKVSDLIPFPSHFLSKTDEPRIQSHPKLLKALQGMRYYSTVKLDGMSATFLIDPATDEFLVCSRNFVRECPVNPDICPYYSVALDIKLEAKL